MSLATAVRLNVVLKDVEPKVLRKIAVPFSIRLDRLHLVLQAAFGWENCHLYAFEAGGMKWAIPDPDFDFGEAPIDARKARLSDIVTEAGAKTVHYLYDFGDGWDHVITVDRFFENTGTTGLPMLIEAKGRCPPEDVGGPYGYTEFLEALSDKNHARHAECADWQPEFDPTKLDKAALERNVEALAKKGYPRPRK